MSGRRDQYNYKWEVRGWKWIGAVVQPNILQTEQDRRSGSWSVRNKPVQEFDMDGMASSDCRGDLELLTIRSALPSEVVVQLVVASEGEVEEKWWCRIYLVIIYYTVYYLPSELLYLNPSAIDLDDLVISMRV